jgi:tetratricopeptide (TPR) repeat protein
MAELPQDVLHLLSSLPDQTQAGGVELLLSQMDPDKAHRLRVCAIPHYFNPTILQVLVPALDREQATEACEELATLALVGGASDLLTIHDEARRYLFNQWLEPGSRREFMEVNARMVKYFMPSAGQSAGPGVAWLQHAIFHSVGADQETGFTGFENYCRQMRNQFRLSECENIIRLVHEYDPVLTREQGMRLTYHEAKLAADRDQWDSAEQLLRRIVAGNGLPGDLVFRAQIRLGLLFADQRKFSTAIEHFQNALRLGERLGPSFHGRALHDLGTAYRDDGDIDRAEELLCKSLEIANELRDRSALAQVHTSLGTLYRERGDFRLAVANYEKTLEYLAGTEERLRQAQAYNNLGAAYDRQNEWEKSEEVYRQSLSIMEELGYKTGQAMVLNNLARVHRNRKRDDLAVTALRDAAAKFEEVHDWYRAAEAKRNLARLYLAGSKHQPGKRDSAREAFDQAAALFERATAGTEARETREERDKITKRSLLPWWVWVAFVLLALFVLLLIAMGIEEAESESQTPDAQPAAVGV